MSTPDPVQNTGSYDPLAGKPAAGERSRFFDKPLGSLMADLTRETSTLIRDEVQLAKVEMSEKVDKATSGAIALFTGGLVVFSGLLVLLAAVTILLADLIEPLTTQPWVAPTIVGLIVAIVGLVMLRRGRHNLSVDGLTPHRSARSLHRDRDMLRGHTR